ncbi:MAG: SIMPL domain-containing protein [Patescibacteria group bacterium]
MNEESTCCKFFSPHQCLCWFAALVALALVAFLGVTTVNKIKEGRYIGQGDQYKNILSVAGEGKVLAKPDVGQVTLSVVSPASTVAVAQKDNTAKMNKISEAMKSLGIKEEDLKTTNYNISPRYQYVSGRSNLIGYEVTQSLEVKIKDLEKAGDILAKAADSGVNQVSALNFTFDDPEKLKAEARSKAIKNAKEKAEALARELGVALGQITSFSENSYGDAVSYMAKEAYGLGGGGAAAPDVQVGQNEIQVNVDITYEIY